MPRWIKRTLLAIAAILAMVATLAVVLDRMSAGTPGWYHVEQFSAEQEAAASQRALNMWLKTRNWAQEIQLAATTHSTTQLGAADGSAPQAMHISFTAEEINAFMVHWGDQFKDQPDYARFLAAYGRHFQHPQVALEDGHLIIGATVKGVDYLDGRVGSIHFAPHINPDGKLDFQLLSIRGGSVPLPATLYAKPLSKLTASVAENLPRVQQGAEINPDGSGNRAAIDAALAKFFLRIIDHQSGDPFAFIPISDKTRVAVRITELSIADHALNLTVVPTTAEERAAFLAHLREPYNGTATPAN